MAREDEKPKPPLIANRYEVREPLGSGGAGAVFKSWDTQLHRFVAVKRWTAAEPFLDDPAGTERMWREAMTLAAIQHPNILTIHDFGVDEEGPYVITEFVDGETLDKVVAHGRFELEPFAEAAQQMLEALIAAHQANLIHRDIKPQNIMRMRMPSGAWQYKILDFGLARFLAQPTVQSLEGGTSIYGSILYIAPEQLRHLPLDARTDIYAFGCLCYFMLSGQNAFQGDTVPALITSHLEHEITPLADLRPDLPKALCDWVMKAMSYSPTDRFASAATALATLGKALPGAVRKTTLHIGPQRPTLQTGPILVGDRGMPPMSPSKAGLKIMPSSEPHRHHPIAPASPPRMAVWLWAPPTAAALLLALIGLVVLLRHKPAPEVEPPPDLSAEEFDWRQSPTVENVIRVWPPYIAPERRPLIQQYFEQVRDLDDPKWGSIGVVLETLAAFKMNANFDPNEFRAICNVSYHDDAGLTLGELDIVVWNMRENRAEVVYEVAVSDQLHRRATPSRNQLRRFENAIQEGAAKRILYAPDPAWKFDQSQFLQARFEILGNQGAIDAGFNEEFDITRPEADFLQRRLIEWRRERRARQRAPRETTP